ncbi:MAG: FHA domain-containing protein [Bacteroidota bacterium]
MKDISTDPLFHARSGMPKQIKLFSPDPRVEGGKEGIVIDKDTLLGRHPSSDIVIHEMGVSRRHAKLSKSSEGWILVDENSTNGTWWNNAKIKRQVIAEEGRIMLYNVPLFVKIISE